MELFLENISIESVPPPLRSCQTTPVPLGLLHALPRSWPHQDTGRSVSQSRSWGLAKDRKAIIRVHGSLPSILSCYHMKQEEETRGICNLTTQAVQTFPSALIPVGYQIPRQLTNPSFLQPAFTECTSSALGCGSLLFIALNMMGQTSRIKHVQAPSSVQSPGKDAP